MPAIDLVILDRDGVINEDRDDFVRSPDQWCALPGSLEAIARLGRRGIRIAIATNQSGIARGLFDVETLNAIHARMRALIEAAGGTVDVIAYCPHGPFDNCGCRKPRPGLVQQIEARLGCSGRGVPFVGDSLRDLEAARAAGCRPVLVRTGHGRRTELAGLPPAVAVFDDLAAFVDDLLERGR